jgi:hypothetical protein
MVRRKLRFEIVKAGMEAFSSKIFFQEEGTLKNVLKVPLGKKKVRINLKFVH